MIGKGAGGKAGEISLSSERGSYGSIAIKSSFLQQPRSTEALLAVADTSRYQPKDVSKAINETVKAPSPTTRFGYQATKALLLSSVQHVGS